MHVVKSRWFAPAAICLALALFAGCQIDSPTGTVGELRYVKISPDLRLHAAPEGYIYELWVMAIDISFEDSIPMPVIGDPISVARFQWDPYLYAATDEGGNFIPLTIGSGMPLSDPPAVAGVFQSANPVAFLTIEPASEPEPLKAVPSGPNLLVFNLNSQSFSAVLINPWELLSLFGSPPPVTSFNLISQSNKKGVPNADWRDRQTEGQGIWFAVPRLDETTVIDEEHGWDTYSTVFNPPAPDDPYRYTVWIHRDRPESSFSNFGQAMLDREPDYETLDGVVIHAPGRYGPSDPIPRTDPPRPPLPGVQLGTDPVMENGVVVGYRYVVNRGIAGLEDTCILRIDDPSLSRCNRDTHESLNFTDTSFLPYTFRLSTGDTTVATTLGSLLDLSDMDALNEATFGNGFIFLGWEYEAWLVFTEASGIPPLSLGRFKSPRGRDSQDAFTFTDGRFDRNFAFPGEDFVQNLSQHHPSLSSPLDVISDPRVEKLWITIEPDDDFGFDWAPDEPNTQLIYLSSYIPKVLGDSASTQIRMIHRDINPSPTGLNNGNAFPRVTVQFNSGPAN